MELQSRTRCELGRHTAKFLQREFEAGNNFRSDLVGCAARESFPAVLFAGALGFGPFAFNELAAAERPGVAAVPQVEFKG